MSVHTGGGGGTYLPADGWGEEGVPTFQLIGGIPTFQPTGGGGAERVLTFQLIWGGVPTFQTKRGVPTFQLIGGGGVLIFQSTWGGGGVVPTLGRYTPVQGRYPTTRIGPPPPTGRQSSTVSTCYAVGGMPLAFTQDDFSCFLQKIGKLCKKTIHWIPFVTNLSRTSTRL